MSAAGGVPLTTGCSPCTVGGVRSQRTCQPPRPVPAPLPDAQSAEPTPADAGREFMEPAASFLSEHLPSFQSGTALPMCTPVRIAVKSTASV